MSSKDELQRMNIKLAEVIRKIDEIHAYIVEKTQEKPEVKEPKKK